MKVILPTRNRLINKLFNTDNAGDDLKYLLKDNLDYVVKKSTGESVKYEVELERKIGKDGREKEQDGQYIIIESEKEKKYIFFTYEFPNETRNGYLVAKIPIAFRNWYNDDTPKKKELGIFLLDIDIRYKSLEIYKNIPLDDLKNSGTINNYNTFAYHPHMSASPYKHRHNFGTNHPNLKSEQRKPFSFLPNLRSFSFPK